MARLVLAVVGAAIVGLAVWAALPSREPASPEIAGSPSAAPGPPTPRGIARVQPSAKVPDTGDEATDRAVASCIGAQLLVMKQRAQRGGPAPAGQPTDAAVVSKACAALYKEPACRKAMLDYDTPPPEVRSATVLQACARAYCPSLPAPKPAVCGHVDNVPQDIQQFQEWAELRKAILTKDDGAGTAELVTNPPRPREMPPAR